MQSGRRSSLFLLALIPLLFIHACGGNVLAPVEAPDAHAKQAPPPVPQPSTKTARAPAPRPVPATIPKSRPESIPVRLPAYHVVTKGETLYSIVWHYGLDYRDVADWNKISPPFIIHPGQRINLRNMPGSFSAPDGRSARKPDTTSPSATASEKRNTGTKSATKEPAPGPRPLETGRYSSTEEVTWSWPTQGSIVTTDSPIAKNGIDIAGRRGQQINASAPGEVVYSGSGLLGYGRLIIIKHNDIFLSAYAHNSELLVQEGDLVKAGQNIALMGVTTNGKALLHFEIRKNGQPIDPLKFLPNID